MFLKQINFVDQNLIIITGISPASTIQYYWYCERKSFLFMCCSESKCCAVEIYSFLNLKSSCLLNLLKMFLVCTNKESLFYEIELININEPISNIVSVVFEVHIQCNSEYNSIQYSVVLIGWLRKLLTCHQRTWFTWSEKPNWMKIVGQHFEIVVKYEK